MCGIAAILNLEVVMTIIDSNSNGLQNAETRLKRGNSLFDCLKQSSCNKLVWIWKLNYFPICCLNCFATFFFKDFVLRMVKQVDDNAIKIRCFN